jgi:hypothetical protein
MTQIQMVVVPFKLYPDYITRFDPGLVKVIVIAKRSCALMTN